MQFVFLILVSLTTSIFGAQCPDLIRAIDSKLRYPSLVRERSIERLKTETFDILVIGGGATGSGIAVDAASRGLKVAMVERRDLASETSSRSTKLVHGGVRYLENAVKNLDPGQLELVRDALRERGNFLKNAPHLSRDLPIMTPVYSWFEAFYYYVGLKMYDWLARGNTMPGTHFMFKKQLVNEYPMLNSKKVKGGLLYHDGQFDDARMNVSLAKTANELNAAVSNHVEIVDLIKENGRVAGARLRNTLNGEEWPTKAKVVVNATGPFTDAVRLMDDPNAPQMLKASSGTHIVLDASFIPKEKGILIPKTKDGRVVFILPWNGKTLVGTTDNEAKIVENPKASEADIDFILETVAPFYEKPPKKEDILSQWTGLRPLVSNPSKNGTASLSRDHVIDVSDSGLVSIAGGKWTTYRKMGEDAVDKAIEVADLKPKSDSRTEDMKVSGAQGFGEELINELRSMSRFTEEEVDHLAHSYGDRARDVAMIASRGFSNRIHPNHPYLEAEVVYSALAESARTVVDVLARRTRLSFLDQQAALDSIPRVADLMAITLKWDAAEKQKQIEYAKNYLSK